MELATHLAVMFDLRWPLNHHRVSGAAEVGCHQFHPLVRRGASPGPPSVIHVVNERGAEHLESAKRLEGVDVLIEGRWDPVLSKQLADCSFLAFSG